MAAAAYHLQFYLSNSVSKNVAPYNGSTTEQKKADKTLSKCAIQCREIYVVAWNQHNDDPTTIERVERLLNGTLLSTESLHSLRPIFVIGARVGTLSTWSSKVLSLFDTCQIPSAQRIERLWAYLPPQPQSPLPLFPPQDVQNLARAYFDRTTQQVFTDWQQCEQLFAIHTPKPLRICDISTTQKITAINAMLGLSLSSDEMHYLKDLYQQLKRNPTDAELMMFAQVNSEHCRHKIFNAKWCIDDQPMPLSLFSMIRNTYQQSPQGITTAYDDNAAILTGTESIQWQCDPHTHHYHATTQSTDIQIKVETHNHPTAISPYPGAATGSGGELRDEAATGRGGTPKAGLVGFSVSHLFIPDRPLSFEDDNISKPPHISSALEIMLQAPIGAARYNNEFGRPCILGYFRSFFRRFDKQDYGYHKPIMLAGGLGTINQLHVNKQSFARDSLLIVLGAAAQLIGLGGGSISSKNVAEHDEADESLDFSSVQRDNAEIQRRCQEVITRCTHLGTANPILSIHDVGAGGISNALPEIVHGSQQGAVVDVRKILSDEPAMSPMEIWCNESQERFVLAIAPQSLPLFEKICQRERCPLAVIGTSVDDDKLLVQDSALNQNTIDLNLSSLLGKMPELEKTDALTAPPKPLANSNTRLIPYNINVGLEILKHPTVGDKSFLITISDRSVGGLVHRDQMVGPKQIPIADCGITLRDYANFSGEAMSLGERTPVAIENSAAAARMAISEAITNILAAPIDSLNQIKLSCNWMAAAHEHGMGNALFEAVKTAGLDFCPALNIAIPVGKDSMSMKTEWIERHDARQTVQKVIAPVSLIVSAFALLPDVRDNHVPLLQASENLSTDLWIIDLGLNKNRLQHSIFNEFCPTNSEEYSPYNDVPDIQPQTLQNGFRIIQQLRQNQCLLAYHDRSDGGLWTTLCEMLFASECSLTIQSSLDSHPLLAWLFNEEIGMVIETPTTHRNTVKQLFANNTLTLHCHYLGQPNPSSPPHLAIQTPTTTHTFSINSLQQHWNETSYHIKKLRDNPLCVTQERQQLTHATLRTRLTPLLNQKLYDQLVSDDYQKTLTINPTNAPSISSTVRPKVAILREQGINGQQEMAYAFHRAGFQPIDVHMSDILNGSTILQECTGLVASGGFSYGDVLGAGQGWAKSILFNSFSHDQFNQFFNRNNTFSFGVCNGCQMLSHLKELIPGATHWSTFEPNLSAQFESRLVQVKITPSPSIMLRGMEDSVLPTIVSHGEGRIPSQQTSVPEALISARYVDSEHQPTEHYPTNPTGTLDGITALTSEDGRVTIMMPHPERTFRLSQYSWYPSQWRKFNDISPWMKLFTNAKDFV